MFFDTLTVLNKLVTNLAALDWTYTTAPSEEHPAGEQVSIDAFEAVELFSSVDPATALNDLIIIAEGRVCLVVPDMESFETVLDGTVLGVKQHLDVCLLITARNWADRNDVLAGDGAASPWVLDLKDTVLNGIVGKLGTTPDVVVSPITGEIFNLESSAKDDLPGRLVYALNLRLAGGVRRVSLGRP
jgi:hypothetical protein